MRPNSTIQRFKVSRLPIFGSFVFTINLVLGAIVVALSLALISAFLGLTSILTSLTPRLSVEETTKLMPTGTLNILEKLSSDTELEDAPQQNLDQHSITAAEDEAEFSEKIPHHIFHQLSQVFDRLLMTAVEDKADLSMLTELALSAEDVESRLGAIQDFGDIGDERAVDTLVQALNDESVAVRAGSLEVLGDLGDETAVEFLNSALADTNAQVRSNAIRALGKVGNGEIMGQLAKALDDSYPDVRISAVEALGMLGNLEGKRAKEFLTTALGDRDPRVREAAELVMADIISQEVDEVPSDTPSQKQDNDVEEDGQPATPGLPGYPTDPPSEMIEDGKPSSIPSEEGISDEEALRLS
jgi:hypothetical protein